MISTYNITSMDAETLMYFFDARMKRLLREPENFKHYTDKQMDLIENEILPTIQSVLKIAAEVPLEHA